MKKSQKSQPQYRLQIKDNPNVLAILRFKLSKIGRQLEQYTYWRSPLLWFSIYINVGLSVLTFSWFIRNLNSLPTKAPILLYQQESAQRFIQTADLVYIIILNLVFQLITLYLGSKIYYKSKRIAVLVLLCSIFSNSAILISIYKMIKVLLP